MAAMASSSSFSKIHTHSFSLPTQNHNSSTSLPLPTLSIISRPPHSHSKSILFTFRPPITAIHASGGGIGGEGGSGSGGGGGGGDGGEGESEDRDRNREEALLVLAEVGKPLDYLPADLAEAVKVGRVPGSIVKRFFELEKSSVFRWLLNFGGFRERLLADDLFLAKVAMECGVGIFTKTAAELEKRKENFTKELDFVCADVVMAGIPGHSLGDPSAMGRPGGPEVARNGRNVNFGGQLPIDAVSRPRPESIPLPPDASSTLYVEGLPSDCTKREVAHIFRPFVGYREVRLVTKESKHRSGDPLILCFVDFANPPCAATAMSALQGYRVDELNPDSNYLRLQFSRSPGPRSGPAPRGKR